MFRSSVSQAYRPKATVIQIPYFCNWARRLVVLCYLLRTSYAYATVSLRTAGTRELKSVLDAQSVYPTIPLASLTRILRRDQYHDEREESPSQPTERPQEHRPQDA